MRSTNHVSVAARWLSLSAALLLSGSLSGCLAGCGDDEGDEDSPPPPPPSVPVESRNPAPGRVPQPGAPGAEGPLTTYLHVEDLMKTEAERATIRHQFRESDFVQDAEGDNRDPFRSYMFDTNLFDPVGTNLPPSDEMCSAKQMVATSYSYRDLRLVGIVSRGLKRYALMQDSANFGQIVTRGDCIGKEKARVKEIGAGYVTLEMKPDGLTPGAAAVAQERSIQLYPDELAINRSPEEDTVLPPVVMPPAPRTLAPAPGSSPGPAPGAAPAPPPPPVVMPPPRTSPPAGSSAPAARPSGSAGAPIVPPS